MLKLGGPMFEPAQSEHWKSTHNKQGAHYNIFSAAKDADEMAALRQLFTDGQADEYNLCLFSTSGVHGIYTTIEEVEAAQLRGESQGDPGDEPYLPDDVTFLVIQPRIVCLRYGNCKPKTQEDFDFLKKLRQSSWEAFQTIGKL